MMEIVEYRPGKWAKVVDGRMVGRATAEEVAAWQAQHAPDATSAEDAPLDIDLDFKPASPNPTAVPGHSLDVPLKPAFERRRRLAQPGASLPAVPAEEDPMDVSIEAAIAREASARRYSERTAKAASSGPLMVRRRVPRAKAPSGGPAREETPTPAEPTPEPKPAAKAAAKTPTREETSTPPPPQPAAPLAPREAEIPKLTEAHPTPEREEPSGPSYWWIYNAHQQPVDVFLQEWLPKYKAKFGHEATFVHCHADDLAGAEQSGLDVVVSTLLQPGHFYLGHEAGGG